MKNLKYFLFLTFSSILFLLLNNSNVFADDENFGTCSTPYHSSGFYNTDSVGFYSYQWYDRWVPPLYNYEYEITEEGRYIIKSITLVRDGYHTPDTRSCYVSISKVSDDRYVSGVVRYSGTTDGGTGYGNVYWDVKVDTYITYEGTPYDKGNSIGVSNNSSENPAVRSNKSSVVTTFSDRDMPTLHCIVTRGDGSQTSCIPEYLDDVKLDSKLRLMCVKYFSPYTNDGDSTCYERAYPLQLKWIKTHDKVYPGFEFEFVCAVTMGDANRTVRTLDKNAGKDLNYVYFMTPLTTSDNKPRGIFIGNYNLKYPYIYPDFYKNYKGDPVPADSLNNFLSYDSYTRDYTVTCAYYADEAYVKSFYNDGSNVPRVRSNNDVFNDFQHSKTYSKPISITHNLTNVGLKKLEMSVDGYFPSYKEANAEFTMVHDTLKSTTSSFSPNEGLETSSFDKDKIFLAGHRYNFKLIAEFTDGKKTDITANPFVYWNSVPHYEEGVYGQFEPTASGFPYNGSGFRYPLNLKKYARADYSGANSNSKQYVYVAADFLQNNALGTPTYGITRLRMGTRTREVVDFEIKKFVSSTSFDSVPRSTTNEADMKITPSNVAHKFASVVTYSDGTVENWTNSPYLNWNIDYNTKSVLYRDYNFADVRSDSRRLTVFAQFQNKYNLTPTFYRGSDNGSSLGSVQTKQQKKEPYPAIEYYESHYDKITIDLTNCNDIKYIALECKGKNPENYGLSILSRVSVTPNLNNRLNDLYTYHPYDLVFTFPINGISEDFKNYKDAEDSTPLTGPYQGKIKVDNRNIFYDVRQFPVSGTSGSTGDN